MQIFTVYTEQSHRPFLDEFFLPTLAQVEPCAPLHAVELQQISTSGAPVSDGFKDTMFQKYQALWDLANSLPYGELILCADCDIQFFRPFVADLERYLEDHDIVFQTGLLNPRKLNIGFTCFRWCPAVRALFGAMLNSLPQFPQEEMAINFILRLAGFPVRWRLLPPEDYWLITLTDNRVLTPEIVPPNPIIHHGCGFIGTPLKIKLMREVREIVLGRKVQLAGAA